MMSSRSPAASTSSSNSSSTNDSLSRSSSPTSQSSFGPTERRGAAGGDDEQQLGNINSDPSPTNDHQSERRKQKNPKKQESGESSAEELSTVGHKGKCCCCCCLRPTLESERCAISVPAYRRALTCARVTCAHLRAYRASAVARWPYRWGARYACGPRSISGRCGGASANQASGFFKMFLLGGGGARLAVKLSPVSPNPNR